MNWLGNNISNKNLKMSSNFCNYTIWLCLNLLILLIASVNVVFSGSIVKYLPGFDGELPFKLETGYVSVGSSELFYYFIESEGNPKQDPLLLWYSGGPGCSALNGLIFENGPLAFNITDYEGGIPRLQYYPYSWTKSASILFVDAPVGTGFSYATSSDAFPTSDTKSAAQTYEFLRKWLNDHQQYLKLQLFIGADSYSGVSGTILVKHVIDGNKDGVQPFLNLKGYILGCPKTDDVINVNSKIIFSHMIGLISDELYESAKESCGGDYYDVDVSRPLCFETLKLINRCTQDINKNDILEPKCTWAASPESNTELVRRSLQEESGNFILSPPRIPEFWCHNFNYALSYVWANDESVQEALHVRRGTVENWKRCNKSLSYTFDVLSVLEYHRNLSKGAGLQVLIYNGDHDLTIPNVGTQQWIRELNIRVVNDWRPWFVDGQTAGYTIKYSENGYRLTYATVKGAGHSPQEYKRRECFNMFERFIHYYPI